MRIEILAGSVANGRGSFVRGDVVDWPECDARPLVASGAALWLDGPEGEALQVDRTTWAFTVPQAKKRIAEETDSATLRAWHVGETRHPDYQPEGRTGVKDAIQERLRELRVEADIMSQGEEE